MRANATCVEAEYVQSTPNTLFPGRYSLPRDAPPPRAVDLDGGVPLVFEFWAGNGQFND